MKVVLFTMNERVFTPLLLDKVLERHHELIDTAYICSKSDFRSVRRTWRQLAKSVPRTFMELKDYYRFAKRLRSAEKSSPKEIIESYGIRTKSIQRFDARTVDNLQLHEADIFLFCPLRLVAGPRTLKLPRLGTFNVHLGKLPEYRGGLSSFWVLRREDESAGASLHRALPEIDSGEIVSEVRFRVDTDSFFELMVKTFSEASLMTALGIDKIIKGDWQPVNTDNRGSEYLLYPTRADFKAFYQQGKTLS